MIRKLLLGIVFAPLEALLVLLNAGYALARSIKEDNRGGLFRLMLEKAATLTVGILCILGFVGTLAIPFPGVTPLYLIGVSAVFKAIGLTLAWSIAARTLMATVNALFEFGDVILFDKLTLGGKEGFDSSAGLSAGPVFCEKLHQGLSAGFFGGSHGVLIKKGFLPQGFLVDDDNSASPMASRSAAASFNQEPGSSYAYTPRRGCCG